MTTRYKPINALTTKWDLRFMEMAKNEVATWSKDPSTKVGCVIVSPDRRQFTAGYNGFPIGIKDTTHRLNNRDLKYELVVHAELNAILNARMNLTGWTLYATFPPCKECAKAIIQAGISRVVCPELKSVDDRWVISQEAARSILNEAGVMFSTVKEEVIE